MAKEIGSPRSGKLETADLGARVERLELEAREHEAKAKIIEAKARLDNLRKQHGLGGKGKSKGQNVA